MGVCTFKINNPVGSFGYEPYPIGSGYGWRFHPVEQVRLFHFGIDVPAPTGEYVRAARLGRVISSRYSKTGGNIVELEHDGGFITRYMHLENRLVDKGELVRAGDLIGTVGATGRVTGSHLHFEIRKPNGESIDPTECYEKAEHVVPYGNEFEDPNATRVPSWVWWVGGGTLVAVIAGIIINENQKSRK